MVRWEPLWDWVDFGREGVGICLFYSTALRVEGVGGWSLEFGLAGAGGIAAFRTGILQEEHCSVGKNSGSLLFGKENVL